MKQFLTDSKLSDPKCLIYLAIAGLQIVVATPDAYSVAAVALSMFIAWKAYLSDSHKEQKEQP
jgi:hypothetical protein|tara:strand:- start:2793 stop:2981 length:189 start_codon:yes stop_codon:yes gene_type:complete